MSAPHELRIERLIDAPIDVVWRAWVDHQDEWFCPRPWRSETVTRDMRPGGQSVIVMRGPDGEENRLEGVFLEVVPERRIVTTDAFTHDWVPAGPFMLRIDEFAPEGKATRYTATARHWTAEAKAGHEAMGFETGWGAAADQLAGVAHRLVRGSDA
jgi:uncharacterized protein YndB with AHSA1/START domain